MFRPTRSGVLHPIAFRPINFLTGGSNKRAKKAQRRKVSAATMKGQNGPFTPETLATPPFSRFFNLGRVVSLPTFLDLAGLELGSLKSLRSTKISEISLWLFQGEDPALKMATFEGQNDAFSPALHCNKILIATAS